MLAAFPMLIALVLTVTGSARAQAAPTARRDATSMLRGVVWDSLANRPLSGARVMAVASSDRAALRSTQSDSNGVFAFSDLLADRYLVTFAHPRLDSLRLVAAQESIDHSANLPGRLTLAIPSAASVYRLHCGASPTDTLQAGLMIGRVAVTPPSPLHNLPETVRGMWRALSLEDSQVRLQTFATSATVGAQGESRVMAYCVDA